MITTTMTLLMSRMRRRSNNIRVMINNTSAMMTSLMCFLTMCMDSLLTLLNVDGVQNFLASLLGDLASVFLGVLVALLLLLVMTLMASSTGLCSTLVITSMTIGFMVSVNNLRLSTNNVRIVVNLFMFFLTMSDYNILALFNISNIYNDIIIHMTFLMMLLLGNLVALVIFLVMTMRTIVISMTKPRISSTIHKSGGQEDN